MVSLVVQYLILLVTLVCLPTRGLGGATEEEALCQLGKWPQFKLEYGKQYAQPEDLRRSQIFCKNLLFVEKENARSGHKRLTLNGLSDLEDAEFERMLSPPGLYYRLLDTLDVISSDEIDLKINRIAQNESLPELVDWSLDPGIVGSVHLQGQCGSCWAFTTTGLIEGQQHKRSPGRVLVELSAQQLVDCDHGNQGCRGGMIPKAIAYVRTAVGLESASSYPYRSAYNPSEYKPRCKYNASRAVESSKNLPRMQILKPGKGDEQYLKQVLANYGPIAVMIQVGSAFRYAGTKVIFDTACVDVMIPNHAVLLVGYGTTPEGEDYWIVKNSWGEQWGSRGFGFMARNRDNNCGVATMPIVLGD